MALTIHNPSGATYLEETLDKEKGVRLIGDYRLESDNYCLWRITSMLTGDPVPSELSNQSWTSPEYALTAIAIFLNKVGVEHSQKGTNNV
jgi:hypothetical protein